MAFIKCSSQDVEFAKVAISLPEIVKETNEFSHSFEGGCAATLSDSNPKDLFLRYNVRCSKPESNPSGHDVLVHFDLSKLEETQLARDLDVRVSCSCVAPDTMVKMADGTEKPISQLKIEDWVLTHKGRARKVLAVTQRSTNPNETAWELTAKGYRDPLVISEDHPLAIVRGNEVCACGCRKLLPLTYKSCTIRERWGRKFLRGHFWKGNNSPEDRFQGRAGWRTPPELMERECLYFPRMEWTGQEVVDPSVASLIGYYLAEGNLEWREKKIGRWGKWLNSPISEEVRYEEKRILLYGVNFTLNQDERWTLAKDIEEKVRKTYGEVPIEIKEVSHPGQKWLTVYVKCPKMARDCFDAVGMYSSRKKLSDWVLRWNQESIKTLLASYALGDGSIDDNTQLVFSISRDLISQISWILFSLGIWNSFHYYKDSTRPGHRLYVASWNHRHFPTILNLMKPQLREKTAKAVEVYQSLDHIFSDSTDFVWGEGFIRSLRKRKIVAAPSVFFDLTVEEDESFIANGIVVHNCPAFTYWSAAYNLHQRDGLEGTPLPGALKPPTERLDLRGHFVVCKHVYVVFKRILPSVQHNIVKILREREVKERKEKGAPEVPTRLQQEQEETKKRQEILKIKDKEVQKKMLDALRKEEEEKLEEEQKTPAWMRRLPEKYKEVEVEREKPATLIEEIEEQEPKPPAHMPEMEQNALRDLYKEDIANRREEHQEVEEEGSLHVHEGLPYKTDRELLGEKKKKKAPGEMKEFLNKRK